MLGDRLLSLEKVKMNGTMMCFKNDSGPIFAHYCKSTNASEKENCDPYFESHEAHIVKGIPGLASGIFSGKSHPALLYVLVHFYLNTLCNERKNSIIV